MSNEIISVKNLTVSIGESRLLDGVTFSVFQGDFLCVTGPNGAGKTTLLKALLGLLSPSSGSIELFGVSVSQLIPRDRIGYLPQKNITINPLFPATVEEVVILGILAGKKFPKRMLKEDYRVAESALSALGICDLRYRSFRKLSGGQQQKVLLARALVRQPEMLILDEPSTALDPQSREEFFQLVEKLNAKQGVTVIIVTHDMDYVGHYASTLLMLDRKVLYFGSAESFLHTHHITHHHDYAGLSHAV